MGYFIVSTNNGPELVEAENLPAAINNTPGAISGRLAQGVDIKRYFQEQEKEEE